MAVTVSVSVALKIVLLDATGNVAATLIVPVEKGRQMGEQKVTFTPDQLTQIQNASGVVYISGPDLLQAGNILHQIDLLGG